VLTYRPGDTVVHRLDPRSKLLAQAGLAAAAFAFPDPRWLAVLTAVGVLAAVAAGLRIRRVLRAYRVVFAFLALGPVLAAVALGPPWFRPAAAVDSLLAVARVVPVLFASAAYTATTPVAETRAAVQAVVPGRVGRLLGVGVGLVSRFFPLVLADARQARAAVAARAGVRRGVRDRAGVLAVRTVHRALDRADTLSMALRARCFAWNPTLPALRFGRADYAVAGVGLALLVGSTAAALAPVVGTLRGVLGA
jgi:biotin transport system permease protein